MNNDMVKLAYGAYFEILNLIIEFETEYGIIKKKFRSKR
jgi:membrane-bound lytic murein transglycosylase B